MFWFRITLFIFLLPSLPFCYCLFLQSPNTFCDTWRCQWRIHARTRFFPMFSTLSSDADDLHDYRTVLYRLRHEYLLLWRPFKVLSSFSKFLRFFRCLCSEFQQ
ncbi:hypothetical protein VNO78_13870 [Psophocarpus tetragonolobus]|uniref:Secreted protein n=1 Tax=Psophocarpus tetragonolobus TaxID=3891 RepID=A0AAN9XQ83_PSOTE